MNKGIADWLNCTNYADIKQKIGKRNIYIWGGYFEGKHIQESFEKNGLQINGYIDNYRTESTYQGLPMSAFNNSFKPEDSFIIVAVIGMRTSIKNALNMNGFQRNKDYLYISEELPHVVISKCYGIYKDIYGNIIQIDAEDFSAEIEIIGYKNQIYVGKDSGCGANTRLLVQNGSKIILGQNMDMEESISIESNNGAIVTLNDECKICKDTRICSKGSEVTIGRKSSIGRRFLCIAGSKAYVKIGNDCMFSSDACVLGTNSHSIFDLSTKENIAKNEIGVYIGNHVWLGKSATVLNNSMISDGCIIGANSLVKTKSEKNCILAGNPARVCATNRTWDRRRDIDFDDL